MEYLKPFNCMQNRFIGIPLHNLEPFDCVQINEYIE